MSNLIKYVLGDWSADGHGITDSYILKTNVSSRELEVAINEGQRITGINLDRLCENYEDSYVPRGVYNYMKAKGIKFDSWQQGDFDAHEVISITSDQYMDLIIALAKEGNSDIQIAYSRDVAVINSGYGYGLFSL